MKKMTYLMMCLTVVTCILFGGCSQPATSETSEGEISGPIIKGDCIVHYYKSNGSAYITRQQHQWSPANNMFRSTSTEPTGVEACTLKNGQFTLSGSTNESLPDLPREQWNEQLATSVYFSFCAGADLLDVSSMKSGENVKIEGQWYQPLSPVWPGQVQVTLLKSLDTNRIELVKTEDANEGFVWLTRSYNYRYSIDLEEDIPRTIDVFDIYEGIASKALMIRFDYKDIRQEAPVINQSSAL